MQSGFNTNVRHRGVLFHVQTEDSGHSNPQIITHLYHGGSILASEKCEYGDRLASSDLAEQVRALMEEQHKALVERLHRGKLDHDIESRLGPSVFADATPAPTPGPEQAPPPPSRGAGPRAAPPTPAGSFGEGRISEKPLDELVFEYLVENARKSKRKRRRK